MTPVVLYARFSSENQRDACIVDQLCQCCERAEREGYTVVETNLFRPSCIELIHDRRRNLLAAALIMIISTLRSRRASAPLKQTRAGGAMSATHLSQNFVHLGIVAYVRQDDRDEQQLVLSAADLGQTGFHLGQQLTSLLRSAQRGVVGGLGSTAKYPVPLWVTAVLA